MKHAILGDLSPLTKLVFLVLVIISGFIIFFIIGILLAIPLFHINLLTNLSILSDYKDPRIVPLLKYFQIIQSFGFFIIPSLLAGLFFEGNPVSYLKMNRKTPAFLLLITLIIMLVSLPLINLMVSVNEMMKLPEILKGIENWMKDAEDQATQLTDAFLGSETVSGLLLNLFMIAILPAFGEEMLFRGVLQRLFSEWFRNVHVAIFFTAFIFGAIHLQFYGILPRMFLGLMFGYLYYWSGSLWLPIVAHFLNNGSAVIVSFLANRGVIQGQYEDFGYTENVYLIITSFILTGFLLFWVYRHGRRKEIETT
ncbi:MAG: CPBP family intramembrane metalloprotease [Bacteroidetes bacterium]|nr:CPBP family intramembrane metalloprotease [Bacteroidota bacterium]